LLVALTYSNAPILEKLGMHYFEANPVNRSRSTSNDGPTERQENDYNREKSVDIQVLDAGARIRGYEFLTDIEVIPNPALHWPWEIVNEHLSSDPSDGKRNLFLLYNPATERRMGTTHTMFASHARIPQRNAAPRGHRHSSSSINYHMEGNGHSVVNGQYFDWSAGDLLLAAPGWAEHAHGFGPKGAVVMTVQDHPLHIGMESLIWQEWMDGPLLSLGSETGSKGYVLPRERGA
jgi:gentisate 1,2-dioxygenase